MGEEAQKKFCPSCGENVETYIVDRGGIVGSGGAIKPGDRKEECCCVYCGMIVIDKSQEKIVPAKSILICDDSSMMRELLKDVLVDNKLTKEVVASKDGADFITLFCRQIQDKKPSSLVVLDVAMPILNGINAAISMRAIEKALKIRATPILFFTGNKCDENFKKVLSYCKPALYVNKGISSTPDLLSSRIGQVVEQLLKERQRES
ncbi:MAG: response regulator [Proteobacteria bacterium]|nr:response regulator [Pseudomonadota bacterium]